MGIGALRARPSAGSQVPRDLSVIGFDGIEMGAFTYPALTTVGYSIRTIGETAATVLIDRSRAAGRGGDIVVKPALILRESTGRQAHEPSPTGRSLSPSA
jgi:LacI family transcriptional regulator